MSEHDGEVRIGAMTRHRALLESELPARRLAIFTDAERVIADPVVRNRGTIVGALCQADPSEDLSAVCAAIGAKMVVRGMGGDRVLGMDEFHRGPYQTAVGSEVTPREAEETLVGQPPSEDLFKRAAAAAAAACRPVTDQRGSAEYKRHVAGVLTERVLVRAATGALPKRAPVQKRTQEV